MTSLAKALITIGITIWTLGTILWILSSNWQWFAGGLSLFIGSLLAGAVLSVETKDKHPITTNNNNDSPHQQREWQRPDSPPPTLTDHNHDPFST